MGAFIQQIDTQQENNNAENAAESTEENEVESVVIQAEDDDEDALGEFAAQLDNQSNNQTDDEFALLQYLLAQQNAPLAQNSADNAAAGSFASYSSHDNTANNHSYLPLYSSAALIVDANTGKVLYEKNSKQVRSIASITKLMAAMVILDAKPNMNQVLTIQSADIDRLKGSSSRLPVGTKMTREKMLHLGLMSSENRAIHAMARNYPGGLNAFIRAMNAKAKSLGMNDTVFYDPTGLDPRNRSTPQDLVKMVQAAHKYEKIRYYSTHNSASTQVRATVKKTQRVKKGKKVRKVTKRVTQIRQVNYRNSNKLIRNGDWDISLQKTGYIREAGRCMVVYANVDNRPVIMVLMNSSNTNQRTNDAYTMRSWLQQM
ncbi:MAG: serine hydrolase [Neisseriaceae bacterium]|nr:serine hydrolase [Neisseriaceae bacterium]